MMNSALFQLHLRGWAFFEGALEDVMNTWFDTKPEFHNLLVTDAVWRLEDSILPDGVVSKPNTLLSFESPNETTVKFVPGSQGHPKPQEPTPTVVATLIHAQTYLILDARCWYSVPAGLNIEVKLWFKKY